MAKETLSKAEVKKFPLTRKVVTIGDYLDKARVLMIEYPKECGNKSIRHIAFALLYSENKVIATVDSKGEDIFICEL